VGVAVVATISLSLHPFFFLFPSEKQKKKLKRKWVIRKCGRWERRDDWRRRSES
jgi:hypothetical protein